MKRSSLCLRGILVSLALCFPIASIADGAAHKTQVSIPLVFEANFGQVPSQYRFVSRHQGVQGLFSPLGPDFLVPSAKDGVHVVRMRFDATTGRIDLNGIDALPGHANYLRGTDRSMWISDIATYREVRYQNLYPGIDLAFHGQDDKAQLEHDFVLAPRADPRSIVFGFGDDEPLEIDASGKLLIGRGDQTLIFNPPQAWQETASGKIPVSASFEKKGSHEIGFRVGKYDPSQTLIIDPVLSFATYLDGTSGDFISDVATDPSGDVYVTGWTYSTDIPIASAKQANLASAPDVFIAKLDPTLHTLLFSTYLGGTNTDQGQSIAVDTSGNVAVSGISSSRDFPAAGKLSSTITTYTTTYNFLASLTANGSALRYSGYIGNTDGAYDDYNPRQNRVAFDPSGNVYMAGLTQDPTYPYTPGAYGGLPAPYPADPTLFVLKAGTDGTILYGATIPESPQQQNLGIGHRIDLGGLAVDVNGAVIVGGTTGNVLPVTTGVLQSAFPNNVNGTAGYILKLNSAGSALVFSTYLPGTDAVEGLAVDTFNNVYASGMTIETNLPTQSTAFQPTFGATCNCWDGFIFKLSSNGTQALAATYFNGATTSTSGYSGSSTVLRDIRVDSVGNVAVGGLTGAANLPLKNPLVSVFSSMGLGFINSAMMMARFSGDLTSLQFSSYLTAIDSSASFNALTIDPQDHLLVAGGTQSKLFQTTPGVYQSVAPLPQSAYSGLNYQFIANVDLSVPAPSLCFDSTSMAFGTVPVGASSQASFNLTNCGNAALTLTSVQSSSSLFTATHNCSAITPGSTCKLQVTYTPTGVGETDGTLTIAGNMAISPQAASFSGAGGLPSVYLPNSVVFSDLLVGETGSRGVLGIFNDGNAPFVLSSAVVTGDFQITQNGCTSPVPAGGTCEITMNFSPTGEGTRTGTLILQDNLSPSTQSIQLTGNGLTTAPVPVITSIPAIAQITSGVGQVWVTGTGFFPNSVVYWNGIAKTTYYGSQGYLIAQLTVADLAQIGESSVTIRTPAPGGGTSNTFQAIVYGRMQNLQVLHAIYNPATSLLYASISSGSSQNANSVVVIDPVAMQITGTLLTGGKPDALALSDDGTLLYVGQDDLQSVSQISLPSGRVNFTVPLPQTSDTFLSSYGIEASALAVVPGKPHTWIAGLCYINVSPCGGGAVIYDDSTMRPVMAQSTQLTANSFSFVNDPSVIYSTEFNQSPPDVSSYSISSTGITRTAISSWGASAGGGTLASDGTSLYVTNGQVIDPSTLLVKYTYPQGGNGGFALDRANSRLFFVNSFGYYGSLRLTAVDLASKSTVGSIAFQEYGNAVDVQRFGVKGVVINLGSQLIFVQTNLANSPATTPVVTVTPTSLSFGSQLNGTKSAAKFVTLNNSGSVPLNISNIAANANDFTLSADFTETNNCPTSLAAGSSCTISVDFNPSSTAYETGQLTIYDNASTGSQIVPLDGTGVATATTYSATASPASLTFASQAIGIASSSQQVTVTNTGTGALTISSIAQTGDFAETNNCGSSLPSGSSCSIKVTFTPTASGSRTGQLTVSDNATAGSQTVSLSGTGAAATSTYSATVTPNSLTFASLGLQTTSGAQTVTLTNTGTGALTISSIAATGDFAATNNCGASLASGAFCTISVTFTPTAIGSRSGQLTISDNATAGPQTVALSGTGTSPISVAPSAAGGNSATVAAGSAANYNLVLGSNGYTGTVAITCTGAPTYATCSVSPASTTLAAGQNANVKVTVTTALTSQADLARPERGKPEGGEMVLAGIGWLLIPALPLLFIARRRSQRAGLLMVLGVAMIAGLANGCGGGGGSTATQPPPVTHDTAPGTYTLTVTAIAGVSSSAQQLTLVVQ